MIPSRFILGGVILVLALVSFNSSFEFKLVNLALGQGVSPECLKALEELQKAIRDEEAADAEFRDSLARRDAAEKREKEEKKSWEGTRGRYERQMKMDPDLRDPDLTKGYKGYLNISYKRYMRARKELTAAKKAVNAAYNKWQAARARRKNAEKLFREACLESKKVRLGSGTPTKTIEPSKKELEEMMEPGEEKSQKSTIGVPPQPTTDAYPGTGPMTPPSPPPPPTEEY